MTEKREVRPEGADGQIQSGQERRGGGKAPLAELPTVAGGGPAQRRILVENLDLPNPSHPIPRQARSGERFVVQDEIGRGGIAVVARGFDQDLRRHVALKRLLDRQAEAVVGLVREAQITAQIEHPNVPAVHDLGTDESGRPFFAMTLVEGRSLSEILAEEGPMPVPRALRIFLQVCYAVAHAHNRGVIHRDIKPQNVVLGKFGEVRLIDWGLAKVLAAKEKMHVEEGSGIDSSVPGIQEPAQSLDVLDVDATRAGMVKGTPGYMAPEQAEGRTDVDFRSDVYGLGALLYRMLSGRKPIEADSLVEFLVAAKRGDVVPIGSVVEVPSRLEAVIHKALALHRGDRYQTVQDLIDDLVAFMDGRPVSAASETMAQRAVRAYFSPIHRWRLRFVDVDMMCGTTAFWSFAIGLALAGLFGTWKNMILWMSLFVGGLMIIPVWRHMRRVKSMDSDETYPSLASGPGSVSGAGSRGETGEESGQESDG